jgi:hypothetical protein
MSIFLYTTSKFRKWRPQKETPAATGAKPTEVLGRFLIYPIRKRSTRRGVARMINQELAGSPRQWPAAVDHLERRRFILRVAAVFQFARCNGLCLFSMR